MNIIETLSKAEKSLLLVKNYPKDKVIFYENDLCETIGIVLEGSIIISSFLTSGKPIIYNELIKGDIFGNNLLFSSDPHYKGMAISKTNSQIAFIKKADLITIIKENDLFLNRYLQKESDFTKSLNSKVNLLSLSSVKDRLLLYLKQNNNELVVTNITSLAYSLHISREALSREITKLVKEKTIIKDNNKIALNINSQDKYR